VQHGHWLKIEVDGRSGSEGGSSDSSDCCGDGSECNLETWLKIEVDGRSGSEGGSSDSSDCCGGGSECNLDTG
jgi:hypothetical protein